VDTAKVAIIIETLRRLCPYLRRMAEKTDNPIDNKIVDIICDLIGSTDDDNIDTRREP
jgi:hypothetical protein